MSLISVVIPVYNSEKTIEKCVNSICVQSYSSLEIILVDDGSTDGSPKLCDCLKEKDIRIKVIHQVNKGVSSARNMGIDKATGKYILFVDSDDYLPKDYCTNMMAAKAQFGEDSFVWTALQVVSENKLIEEQRFYFSEEEYTVLSRRDVLKLSMKYILNSPVNKLYSLDIIKDKYIRMDEKISIAEDLLFNLQYLDAMGEEKIIILNQVAYFYVRNGYTTLDHGYRNNYYEIHRKVLEDLWNYTIKWNAPKEDIPLYYDRYWEYMQSALQNNNRTDAGLSYLAKMKENNRIIKDDKFQKCLESKKNTMGRGSYLAYRSKSFFLVRLYDNIRKFI